MGGPTPPLWLLALLERENVRWDELPEELQLALPYCPPEVAHEILRIFKVKMEEIEEEIEIQIMYYEQLDKLFEKQRHS